MSKTPPWASWRRWTWCAFVSPRAGSLDEANALIDPIAARVRDLLPGLIMGVDEDTLESVVDGLLCERNWTLAVVETQTGGAISQRFTAAGARSFTGGLVLPHSKTAGSDPKMLARSYAQKVSADHGATCGLSLIADPRNQNTCVVFTTPDGTAEWTINYFGTDERGQVCGSVVALENVRRHLTGVAT